MLIPTLPATNDAGLLSIYADIRRRIERDGSFTDARWVMRRIADMHNLPCDDRAVRNRSIGYLTGIICRMLIENNVIFCFTGTPSE